MLPALLLLALPAWAGELVPRWDAPVRFHAEALLKTPNGYRYLGRQNVQASVRSHEIAVDLSCGPADAARQVLCTLDRVDLGGAAFTGDQEDLDAILVEYEALLLGQQLQVSVATDGRIVQVDLEGVSKQDDRMAEIHETLRQLLRRVLTPLDLGLPRKGDPKGGTWRQKGTPMLFQLMTAYGTAGGSVMRHTLESQEGDRALISSAGHGNLATGLDFEVGAGELVNMIGVGEGSFDLATGQIAWRRVSVTGELTAESIQLGDPMVYALSAWAGRIGADGTIEVPPATP